MRQLKCPMELNYHRPLIEFKTGAQDDHLEKKYLIAISKLHIQAFSCRIH